MHTMFSRSCVAPFFNGTSFQSIGQSFHPHGKISSCFVLRFFSDTANKSYSSATLKDKVWAVHATRMAPIDGTLSSFLNRWDWRGPNGPTIPLTQKTIHWSLGELPRSIILTNIHSQKQTIHSFEGHAFAVVAPLKALAESNQLINLFPFDTFTSGNVKLTDDFTFLMPQNVEILEITDLKDKKFKVLKYNPQTGLRTAVDEVIKQAGGWTFRMPEEGGLFDNEVTLDGQNVNTPEFFQAFLKEYPTVSFGDAFHSLSGDAYLFTFVKKMIHTLYVTDNESEKFVYCTLLKHFYPKATKYFDKEEQLKIENFIMEKEKEISGLSMQDGLSCYVPVDFFHAMTWDELENFQLAHPELFSKANLPEFNASWAACRWLFIGNEQGLKEGLDKKIQKEFQLLKKREPHNYSASFIDSVKKHNCLFSNRKALAETILNIDTVKNLSPP